MEQRLLTLEEVADRLRRTPSQIRWMRHKHTGPPGANIGGRVMYRETDVNAWINAHFDTPKTDSQGAERIT